MTFEKGDRIKHPTRDDWGVGEILESQNGEFIRAFFVGVGEKTLSLKHVQPLMVIGDEAKHPVLDNLKLTKTSTGPQYQSLPQSMQFFLQQFPEGFRGKKFQEHEREYKERAHALATALLGKETFANLLSDNDCHEITKRALKVVNATNLIFPNEKMALKDGLAESGAQIRFSASLFSLLYGKDTTEQRFTDFFSTLENIGAAKWTTASYFPFIAQPSIYMFVKPTITQHSAELCRFEINYSPHLNWLTYKSILEFSEYLLTAISDLKPRDMIDVQSFMWCIAPGKYRTV